MSDLLANSEAPSDAELISAVRTGDADAYGQLFARHRAAAEKMAAQLVRGTDVDDLVSEAFAKVFTQLTGGGGPDVAFRAYLLTAVRRLHVDRVRAAARVQPTGEVDKLDTPVEFQDPALQRFEHSATAKAFASLPERWQLVLWHLDVEGAKPADIAPLLGMSPNSVSALAYRAREGLRQAYLQGHLADTGDSDCRWTTEHLGAYVRGGLAKRDTSRVSGHLEGCRRCTGVYLELAEVNSSLAGVLAPALLGGAATGYLAVGSGKAAILGLPFLGALVGRVRDWLSGAGTQVALVAAGVLGVAVAGTLVYVSAGGDSAPQADKPAGVSSVPSQAPPDEKAIPPDSKTPASKPKNKTMRPNKPAPAAEAAPPAVDSAPPAEPRQQPGTTAPQRTSPPQTTAPPRSTESPRSSPTPTPRPGPPTHLTKSVSADGDVTLTWRAPRDSDVKGYEVYRKPAPARARTAPAVYHPGAFTVAPAAYRPVTQVSARRPISGDKLIEGRRYTDTRATPGNWYVYTVKAVGPDGKRSTAARRKVWVPKEKKPPEEPPGPEPVAEGQLRTITKPQRCIEGSESGLVLEDCGKDPAKHWTEYDDDTLRALGKCLTHDKVSGKSAHVYLAQCRNDLDSQQWKIDEAGEDEPSVVVRSVDAQTHAGNTMVLDADGGTGPAIILYDEKSESDPTRDNQLFMLEHGEN